MVKSLQTLLKENPPKMAQSYKNGRKGEFLDKLKQKKSF